MRCQVCGSLNFIANYGNAYCNFCFRCYGTEESQALENAQTANRFSPDMIQDYIDKKFPPLPKIEEIAAPLYKRILNFLIDGIAASVLGTILIPIGLALILLPLGHLGIILQIPIGLAALLSPFLYFFLSETYSSKTLGKLLTGTKVIVVDGSKPIASVIFLRTLVRFIPLEALSFLIYYLVTGKPTGWHDSATDTIVVNS